MPFSPGVQPNPAQLSLQVTSRQQDTILEERLHLTDGPCSELFGPGIGGSPPESLGASRRSCNPSDPSMFESRVPSGSPKSVTRKRQNSSLSRTSVWSFRKRACFAAALDARGWLRPNVRAGKTQLLGIDAMLTYVFAIFLRNAYHTHGFSENSFAYVNVLLLCLLVPLGGRRGPADEGLYSSSRCLLVDLCFCANSVPRSRIPCSSRLFCSSLVALLVPLYLCSLVHLPSQGRAVWSRII